MSKPLEYYFVKKGVIEHVIFNKYTIENGIIINKKTGKQISYHKIGKYNVCRVTDDTGKAYTIYLGRAIASTICGLPPTPEHTADHIDQNPHNDTDDNIRWLCKSGQGNNRTFPTTLKDSFIIIKDGDEKTAKEWVDHLKDDKSPRGKDFNERMIQDYSRRKKYGFSYKEYPDLIGEVWKKIPGSDNVKGGYWKISNMNRVKYITKFAENVLSGERLGKGCGYPRITINGRQWYCHILSFMTFLPEDYDIKKPDEIILHEDDDPMDFRPHKLRIGTRSENTTDAYNNGKYDGTKSAMVKCASYINGVFEKEHESQHDAVRYLRLNGYTKASPGNICYALCDFRKTVYDRAWKFV